jgi:unspecific monooxygenase
MFLPWFLRGVLLLFLWGFYKLIVKVVLAPAHFPKNIPTIPFYYTLIPFFKEVDQEELYYKYLERPLTEYGAVKIFFGGHWNVLITRPAYMAQVLKHDEDFPKAGNHVKNPDSVLALYTGENIISAIGDTWRQFAALVRPALQVDVDASIIVRNAHKLINTLLQEPHIETSVEMQDHIQAYAIANMSESLLGSSFEVRSYFLEMYRVGSDTSFAGARKSQPSLVKAPTRDKTEDIRPSSPQLPQLGSVSHPESGGGEAAGQ